MKKKPAQDDATPQVARYFVDAQGLLKELEKLGRTERLPDDVVHIYGHGGLGKTSLLAMFAWFCRLSRIVVALVNGAEVKDPPGLLEKLARELKLSGTVLPAFERSWKEYQTNQAKITALAQRNREATASAVKQAAEVVGGVAKLTPVPGALVEAAIKGSAGVAGVLQSWLSREDLELYWNAQERLADRFRKDLEELTRTRRVVLLLDTYEQLSGMDSWIQKWSASLPSNVLLAIAGRHKPKPEWFDATSVKRVRAVELVRMRDENIRSLVQRYFDSREASLEPGRADTIVRLSNGLPLAAALDAEAWIAHREWSVDEVRGTVTPDVFHRLRQGLPPHVVEALDAGTVVRSFNRETLRSLMDDPKVANEAYGDLTSLHSLLRERGEGFALHDTVVENAREFWRLTDPEHWQNLHRRALEFYERVLTRMEADHAELSRIQKIILEILYQRHEISPRNWINFFQTEFEEAFFWKRQFDFCRQLVNDAMTYALSPESHPWLEYYQARLAILEQSGTVLARSALERLRNDPVIDPDLRVRVLEFLATSGWYDKLEHASGTQEAAAIYQELILTYEGQNNPSRQARAEILLGILRQRTEGRGESHFRTALSLLTPATAPDRDLIVWAQRELSISLRMQGRFQESENLVESSIAGSDAQHLDFQKAHSLLNYGFLLAWTGRLRRAELSFNDSMRLFTSAGHVQPIESAWPRFGLGLVEQCRGRYDAAARRYKEAADIWQGDLFGTPVCDTSCAELCVARGEWDRAIGFLERSEEARRSNEDMFGSAWALRVRGYALLGKGRCDEACELLARGKTIMHQYRSAYGESALALGLCQAYSLSPRLTDFETAAAQVAQLASGKDRFMEHLACLNVLRGLLALSLARSSGHLDAEQVIEHFTEALTCAGQHNVYLLDELADEIVWTLKSRSDLVEGVKHRWNEARIEKYAAVEFERERRTAEAVDSNHLTPVSDRLAGGHGPRQISRFLGLV